MSGGSPSDTETEVIFGFCFLELYFLLGGGVPAMAEGQLDAFEVPPNPNPSIFP